MHLLTFADEKLFMTFLYKCVVKFIKMILNVY